MEKINIKSPIHDRLEGTGANRLDWSEGSKMHSTVKRLVGSFEQPARTSVRASKPLGTCPKCGWTWRTNNPDRVPNHPPHRDWFSRFKTDKTICPGSWSQEWDPYLDHRVAVPHIEVSHGWRNPVEVISPGDSVLIDFTRAALKPYWPGVDEIKEVKLEEIIVIQKHRRDGSLYSESRQLRFSEVPNTIPQLALTLVTGTPFITLA